MMGVCFVVTDVVLHKKEKEAEVAVAVASVDEKEKEEMEPQQQQHEISPFGPLSGQMITVKQKSLEREIYVFLKVMKGCCWSLSTSIFEQVRVLILVQNKNIVFVSQKTIFLFSTELPDSTKQLMNVLFELRPKNGSEKVLTSKSNIFSSFELFCRSFHRFGTSSCHDCCSGLRRRPKCHYSQG